MENERIIQIIPALAGTQVLYKKIIDKTDARSKQVVCWDLVEYESDELTGETHEDGTLVISKWQTVEAMVVDGDEVEKAPAKINYKKPNEAKLAGYYIPQE